jgi:DNA-binding transcriptional regulator YhcF (GntR family)
LRYGYLYEDSKELENVIDGTRPIFVQMAGQLANAFIAAEPPEGAQVPSAISSHPVT